MIEPGDFYVYQVMYPLNMGFDGLPAYVGKGAFGRAYRDFRKDHNSRLRELARKSTELLKVEIVVNNLSELDAFAHEMLLIKKHSIDGDYLLNARGGRLKTSRKKMKKVRSQKQIDCQKGRMIKWRKTMKENYGWHV